MNINLKSQRVIIKNFTLKDINIVYINWFNGKKTNLKFSRHYRKCYNRNFLIKNYLITKSKSIFIGIFDKKSLELIGTMIVLKQSKGLKYNVGILIGNEKYLSKGYAFESLKLFVDYVFKKTKCKFITLGTDKKNSSMIKLAKKFKIMKKLNSKHNSIVFEFRKYS